MVSDGVMAVVLVFKEDVLICGYMLLKVEEVWKIIFS